MTDPVTIAAGAVVKLAFDEFVKSSAGETAKKLTGEALVKANELRKFIFNYFTGKKNQKATEVIVVIEKTGADNALGKLEVYLEDAMESDKLFATRLKELFNEVESRRAITQVMLEDVETEENIEAEGLIQTITTSDGDVHQTILKGVTTKGSIILKNSSQNA
jgi:hypothetical protein